MKRNGIMNASLAGRMAALGHTQTVAIVDVGLPVPPHVPTVDLALVQGVPTFAQVLDALLDELVVETYTLAEENDAFPTSSVIRDREHRMGTREAVSHEDLKTRVAGCAFVVRTGENTPYANVILRCGVPF